LSAVGRFLSQLSIPFIIGGDMNMTPAELRGIGWLDRIDASIIAPDVELTCTAGEGRVLDWFVVANCLLPDITSIRVVDDTPWRPHVGVILELAAKPRQCMLHAQPKPPDIPRAFGPDLPWQTSMLLASDVFKDHSS